MSYIVKSVWNQAVHLIGTGHIDLVIVVVVGQTTYAITLDLSLPIFGGRPYCGPWLSNVMAQSGYAVTTITTFNLWLLVVVIVLCDLWVSYMSVYCCVFITIDIH